MACSKLFGSEAERSLECSVCFSDFIKPKQLPCLHSFCLKCLQEYCKDEHEGGTKACPLCRTEFSIPMGGVTMLRSNEFLIRLVLERKSRDRKSQSHQCELCVDLGEQVDAEAFCMDCQQCLCMRCKQIHAKMKMSQQHKVVDIDEKPSDAELETMKSNCCIKHGGKEYELYCCDCKVLLCYSCHATDHNKHKCMSISEAANSKKISIQGQQTRVQDCCDSERTKTQSLSDLNKKIVSEVSDIENSLEEMFSKVIQAIQERRSELREELKDLKLRNIKEIESLEDMSAFHSTELNSFLAYSRMVMERGTDCEIVRVADELNKRAEVLIKSQVERNTRTLPNVDVKLSPSCEQIVQDVMKVFGNIEIKECLQKQDDENSHLIKNFSTTVIGDTDDIVGLAVVFDRIFVVQHNKPQVNVYSQFSCRPQPYINIPDLEYPMGLAGCSYHKALYICDIMKECIHRVSLNLNSVPAQCWKLTASYHPMGLSITAEHNLLVTAKMRRAMGKSRVVEYTTEGKILKYIELDESIRWASHTVELHADEFIICHGRRGQGRHHHGRHHGWHHGWPGMDLHRLCVINSRGQIIKSYGGERGQGQGQLNMPRSLTIDNSKSLVFVADWGNDRVLMFRTDLTFLGPVETVDNLQSPYCTYFDSVAGRLIVGQLNQDRLAVEWGACTSRGSWGHRKGWMDTRGGWGSQRRQ